MLMDLINMLTQKAKLFLFWIINFIKVHIG